MSHSGDSDRDAATARWERSPWVLEAAADADRRLWLGPSLVVLDVPSKLDGLDASALETLEAQGFLRPRVSSPALPAATVGSFVLIVDPFFEEAEVTKLLSSLTRSLGGPWTLASWASVLAAKAKPELVVYFGAREDVAALAEYVSAATVVVIAGESAEGPHVGPCLRGSADLEAYVKASRDWASSTALDDLGFEGRPISIGRYFGTSSELISESISNLVREPFGSCYVIDEEVARPFRLWTGLGREESFEALRVDQAWSKGLFSALEVSQDGPIFLGACTTPAGADAISEVAGGKGTERAEALIGTLGEAIERFCMAQGYRGGVPVVSRAPDVPPGRFHPVGQMWDDHLVKGNPSPGLSVYGRDEISGLQQYLPADLCIERESGFDAHPRISGITSSGLAAYPDYEGAVLRGALEILECDSFYPSFLNLVTGTRVPLELLLDDGAVSADLAKVESYLRGRGQECTFVRFESVTTVPIVHAFLWDDELRWMSRGFGSGKSWALAGKRALLEACQIMTQHHFVRENGVRSDTDLAYKEWQSREVTTFLRGYLDTFTRAEALPVADCNSDRACLDWLKADLAAAGRSLYAVPFPCPTIGWSAVRALITGATVYQEASRSEGGDKILTRSFMWGVPI